MKTMQFFTNKNLNPFRTMLRRPFLLGLLILSATCFLAGTPVSADELSRALTLMDQGNHSRAISKLKGLLQTELSWQEKREIHHVLGYCYEKLKNHPEAVRHYVQVTSPSYPLADCAMYRLARFYESMKNEAKAIKWYAQLVRDYPNSFYFTEAKWALAQLYLKQEQYEAARLKLVALISDGHYARDAAYALGRCYEALKDVSSAYHTYQQLLAEKHSDRVAEKTVHRFKLLASEHKSLRLNTTALLNCGLVFLSHKKWKSALTEFERIVATKDLKLKGKVLYFMGQSYQGRKWYNTAIKKYKAVVALGDKTEYLTRANYQLAQCYRQKGHLKTATSRLENFVNTYTWSELIDNALYDIAQIHEKRGNSELAIKAYSRLIEASPDSQYADVAGWRIGWQRFNQGRYEDSYHAFKGLKENFPGNRYAMGAHFWMAKIRERQNKPTLARTLYNEVAKARYWYYSARAKEILGIAASELEPKAMPDTELPQRVACPHQVQALMKLHLYEDAVAQLSHHINTTSNSAQECFYALITCYEELARYDKAREVTEKALARTAFANKSSLDSEKLRQLLYPRHYADLVEKYAKLYEVDTFLMYAMILEESRYRADAISWAGAIGLMQIMPATGKELAQQLKIRRFRPSMLKRPEVNIQMGAKYIGYLNSIFNSNPMLVTGAYNGGPGRMKRWVTSKNIKDIDEFVEKITIRETRLHIKKVINSYGNYVEIYGQHEAPAVNSAMKIPQARVGSPIIGQRGE